MVHNFSRRAVRRAALLFFLGSIVFVGWLFSYAETKGPDMKSPWAVVTIAHRSSAAHIGHILAEAGLIHEDGRFLLLAKITGYSRKFQAGEFRLATGLKPLQVMHQLAEAQPVQHPVTIPEGLRAEEIADIYAKGGWCGHDEFLRLVHDSHFIASLGLKNVSNLEGYLFRIRII